MLCGLQPSCQIHFSGCPRPRTRKRALSVLWGSSGQNRDHQVVRSAYSENTPQRGHDKPEPVVPPRVPPASRRLLPPPVRQDAAAAAVSPPSPSSLPRVKWKQSSKQGSSTPPDSRSSSNSSNNKAAVGSAGLVQAVPPGRQHQQPSAPEATAPAARPSAPAATEQHPTAANPSGAAAQSSSANTATATSSSLPTPQAYLQQQQQLYTRQEQQQQTQQRCQQQLQQLQQQLSAESSPAAAADAAATAAAAVLVDPSLTQLPNYPAVSHQHSLPPPEPLFTPVHRVSKTTAVHALGGSLHQESRLSPHQLVLAWGPDAVNIAVKGCATACRKLRGSTTAWDLVVQPTLRGHGVGAALALDVLKVPRITGIGVHSPGSAEPGVVVRRIASSSNELVWAQTLASNMPQRRATVLRVCGAHSVLNAVMAVALARERVQRATGHDLVLLPQWAYSRAYKREVGLQLVVLWCTSDFPPKVLLDAPGVTPPE